MFHQGQHWIRLHMKKGVIVKKLMLTVDPNDDNYLPTCIVVMGGEMDSLRRLNEVRLEEYQHSYSIVDVTVLDQQAMFHKIIEIRIKECKDEGIDTRIHGIKIKSNKEQDSCISMDCFASEHLVRLVICKYKYNKQTI